MHKHDIFYTVLIFTMQSYLVFLRKPHYFEEKTFGLKPFACLHKQNSAVNKRIGERILHGGEVALTSPQRGYLFLAYGKRQSRFLAYGKRQSRFLA